MPGVPSAIPFWVVRIVIERISIENFWWLWFLFSKDLELLFSSLFIYGFLEIFWFTSRFINFKLAALWRWSGIYFIYPVIFHTSRTNKFYLLFKQAKNYYLQNWLFLRFLQAQFIAAFFSSPGCCPRILHSNKSCSFSIIW